MMARQVWVTLMSGTTAGILAGIVPAHPSSQRPSGAPALVFDRVTVVDVEHGKLLPAQRVIIVGNHIQTVGPATTVHLPAGAQVVDARGKYLIPGLWDMHTHSERAVGLFYRMFLANGVTGIRDASSSVPLDTLRQWRQEILAGTRAGPPRQVLSGPMLQTECGNVVVKCVAVGRIEDSTQFAARVHHVIDSLKAAGADMIKLRDLSPATAYFPIADEARRLGIPFGGHAWDSVDVEVSNRGASVIDHLENVQDVPSGLRISCLATLPTANLVRCKPMAERFKHNRTWVVPTLTLVVGRLSTTSRTNALARQLRQRAAEFILDTLLPHGNWIRDSSASAQVIAGSLFTSPSKTLLPDSLGVLHLMQRTDFPIAAGTDVAPEWVRITPPGFSLHTELAIYVAEGLTPLKALQSATLEPAKLLRATDSLGTVARGKLANLVLLDANPLEDITNTTTIRAVVANGRYFDRTALDQLLTEARAAWDGQ